MKFTSMRKIQRLCSEGTGQILTYDSGLKLRLKWNWWNWDIEAWGGETWYSPSNLVFEEITQAPYYNKDELVDCLWHCSKEWSPTLFFKNGAVRPGIKTEIYNRIHVRRRRNYTELLLNKIAARVDDEFLSQFQSFRYSGGNWYYIPTTLMTIDRRQLNGPRIYLDRFNFMHWEGEWFSSHEMRELSNGERVPLVVYQELQGICSVCGNEGAPLHRGVCHTCLGYNPDHAKIKGYSEKAPDFLDFQAGKYSNIFQAPLYMGIELELESHNVDDDLIVAAKTLGKHCIFKRDGSLSSGFEIVSRPATRDIHTDAFKAFFESKNTLRATSSCGLHIHVSKNAFSMLTLGKLTEFMNKQHNEAFIKKIAGRDSIYAQLDDTRTVGFVTRTLGGTQRYNALNLCNRDTAEFRVFASTKKWNKFLSAMEFVEALCIYCSPCVSKAKTLKETTNWEPFVEFCGKNKKIYPNLWTKLSEES